MAPVQNVRLGFWQCVRGVSRRRAQLLRRPHQSVTTGQQREYFLYLPVGYDTEKGKEWPVILFLHGGGERGDGLKDLDVRLKHGPLMEAWVKGRDLPFIMISPQMPAFPLKSS
jgi:predicted peptidase